MSNRRQPNFGDGGLLVPKEASVIKSVYCNYRGYLIVYDVHGKKVHELSGELTYEKYLGIEDRTDKDITEFDGLDDYRCFACELKKRASEVKDDDDDYDPFSSPIRGNPIGNPSTRRSSGMLVGTPLQPRGIQNSAKPPVSPSMGEFYYDTEIGEIGEWNGTYWYYTKLRT